MAQTHIDAVLAISDLPQNDDLDESGFASLEYIDIEGLVNLDNTGVQQNIVSQNTWDTDVTQKGKGFRTGNDPTATIAMPSTFGAGLQAMLAAAETANNYAFRITYADGLVEYNRGLVTDPELTKGDGEAFRNAIFTIGTNQRPVIVQVAE